MIRFRLYGQTIDAAVNSGERVVRVGLCMFFAVPYTRIRLEALDASHHALEAFLERREDLEVFVQYQLCHLPVAVGICHLSVAVAVAVAGVRTRSSTA